MEVKQKKNNSIKIATALVVVALIAVFVWYFAVFNQKENASEEPAVEVTEEAIQAQQDAKEELVNSEYEKTNSEESQQDQADFNVGFTAVNQMENNLQVRVLIDKIIPESTCRLILSNGSQQVIETTVTVAMASNSTCQGFDVPLEEISPGSWEVRVQIDSQGQVKETVTNIEIT